VIGHERADISVFESLEAAVLFGGALDIREMNER
jgi:hypothetical protein